MKKGKLVGNEIPWYKPHALQKRNRELEALTNVQFQNLSSQCDEMIELKSKIKNRDMLIKTMEKSIEDLDKENEALKSKIIDLENNIELLFNNLSKTKQKQIRG